MDDKNKKAAQIFGLAGALVAAMLLVRKKVGAAMGAAVSIRVLDAQGQEVPHNSPAELEPGGSYTIEVTVTNLSTSKGEPVEALLSTSITAVADGTPLISADIRTDSYEPSQPLVFTWPLNVPSDIGAASGAISAIVLDPNSNQLATATLPITIIMAGQTLWGHINVPGALIEINGISAYSQADGNYSIPGIPAGVYDVTISALGYQTRTRRTSVIPGDANENGVMDVGDITKLERILVGLDPPTPSADANQDGVINAGDITKVERILVGLDNPLTTIMYNVNLTPEVAPVVYAASVDVAI